MKHYKLTIELVPRTAFGINLRSILANRWDEIRKQVYEQSNGMCQICGANTHELDAHEVWHFSIKERKQTLVNILGLCKDCHMVKHIGLAKIKGKEEIAKEHLMKVNDIPVSEANNIIEKAFDKWIALNQVDKWQLDISFVNIYIES